MRLVILSYLHLALTALYYMSVIGLCVCVCVLGYSVRRALHYTLRGRAVAPNYTLIVNLFGGEYTIV